jgi:Protein of unknown function (DUF4254)
MLVHSTLRQSPLTSLPLVALHTAYNQAVGWPHSDVPTSPETGRWPAGLLAAVLENHRHNCLLWRQEDLARRVRAADADIVANKRQIDAHNQARNNAIEKMDECLLLALGLVDANTVHCINPISQVVQAARLNSETAGSMVDRMSITSLKIRAMQLQTQRTDADENHIESARQKLVRLEEQQSDLGHCLDTLLADSLAGRAYFKIYRQFKMYNDPAYNLELRV